MDRTRRAAAFNGRNPTVRVLVLGTAGAGKTTFAQAISQQFGVPCVELDSLYWGPNWTPCNRELFRSIVEEILNTTTSWVIDGNYRSVRPSVAANADLVVWLDYALPVCLWHLVRRTVVRFARQDELWNGNRESLRLLIRDRLGFFRWAIREHRRLRSEVPALGGVAGPPAVIRVRRRSALADVNRRVAALVD
jgi:adenylate kinase family enzyme